jgi:hypothetical protein
MVAAEISARIDPAQARIATPHLKMTLQRTDIEESPWHSTQ